MAALEEDYEKLVQLAAKKVRQMKGAVPLSLPATVDIPAEAVADQEAAGMDGTSPSGEAVRIILTAIRAGAKAPSWRLRWKSATRHSGRLPRRRRPRKASARS